MVVLIFTADKLNELASRVFQLMKHPNVSLNHARPTRVYKERLRLYNAVLEGREESVDRKMLDEFGADFPDIGKIGHFPEWTRDKALNEKITALEKESYHIDKLDTVDESQKNDGWSIFELRATEIQEQLKTNANTPKNASDDIFKSVYASELKRNYVETGVFQLGNAGFSDEVSLDDVLAEGDYTEVDKIREVMDERVITTLTKTPLRVQLDREGNTYINLNGVVSRREVIATLFALYNKKDRVTNQKLLLKKVGRPIDTVLDDIGYLDLVLSNGKESCFGSIGQVFERSVLDLPITRLELALLLERFGFIINDVNIDVSLLVDMQDLVLYMNNDTDFYRRICDMGYNIERYIANVMSGNEPLIVTDVTRVVTMLKQFNLLGKLGVKPFERVNRLEFMLIFGS